jgi:hypothetical protein
MNQSATLTATYADVSKSADITLLSPDSVFHLKLQKSEFSGVTNGSSVTPSVTPGSLTGRVVTSGSGSIQFAAGELGAMFLPAGPQNINKAFLSFAGSEIQNVFGAPAGEIAFSVQSRYSLRERRGLPSPNARWMFDVMDTAKRVAFFQVQTSGNRLAFTYQTSGSAAQTYMVPNGQEDVVFGKGVIARFRVTWNGAAKALYINDKLVSTQSSKPANAVWGALSSLTVGATDLRSAEAAAYASDDAISDLRVIRVSSGTTGNQTSSKSLEGRGNSAQTAYSLASSRSLSIAGIRNAGSGSAEVVCGPGSTATISGRDFVEGGTVFADPSGSSKEGSGVRILVNGTYVPVLYVSATHITFACPDAVSGTRLDVSVETVSERTPSLPVTQADRAVAITGTEFVREHSNSTGLLRLRVLGLSSDDVNRIRVLIGHESFRAATLHPVAGLFGIWEVGVHVPVETYGNSGSVQVHLEQPNGEQVLSNALTLRAVPAIDADQTF